MLNNFIKLVVVGPNFWWFHVASRFYFLPHLWCLWYSISPSPQPYPNPSLHDSVSGPYPAFPTLPTPSPNGWCCFLWSWPAAEVLMKCSLDLASPALTMKNLCCDWRGLAGHWLMMNSKRAWYSYPAPITSSLSLLPRFHLNCQTH